MESMDWVRGDRIGNGSFATVDIATAKSLNSQFPQLMAVKSVNSSNSTSLKNEKQILDRIGNFPQIIRCFGDNHGVDNHEEFYNLFLEFASKGSLADYLKNSGGKLTESDVRRLARSVVKGISYIHAKGFVHCDIKPQNLLMFDDDSIKIADFGLGKEIGDKVMGEDGRRFECRGTPLYMSPETVNENEYEPPADIWALGCTVVEMFTGKSAWTKLTGLNMFALLMRIGVSDELPEIPTELSEEGKDFLRKIFVKDPRERWTAEMLLDHPFLAEFTVPLKVTDEIPTSPRSHLNFTEWVLQQSMEESSVDGLWSSAKERIRQMASKGKPDWSFSRNWVNVR